MKPIFFTCCTLACLAGCHHTADITVDDGKGGAVSIKSSAPDDSGKGEHLSIKSDKGSVEVNGDKMTATDDKGAKVEINHGLSEADLGVPFYPGSIEGPGTMNAVDGQKKTALSIRTTPDSPQQVLDFYKGKLGEPKDSGTTDSTAVAHWKKDNLDVAVAASKQDGKTSVSVTTSRG